MDQVGGFVFGAQVGQALGTLAKEVLSSSEIGLPLSAPGRPALVPANLAQFSAGLAVPPTRCGSTSRCASWPTSACSPRCPG